MPEQHRFATRVGTIVFEIEQDPEGSELWGVWEKLESDPDGDEIVVSFHSEEACKEWIRHTLSRDSDEYLRGRGFDDRI